MVVFSIVAATLAPSTHGVVTGHLQACRAIIYPGAPAYTSGTVTIYRGDVTWQLQPNSPSLSFDIVPKVVVAKQKVGADGWYRFDLAPGHYLMDGTTGTGTSLYVDFRIGAADERQIDIPNLCI